MSVCLFVCLSPRSYKEVGPNKVNFEGRFWGEEIITIKPFDGKLRENNLCTNIIKQLSIYIFANVLGKKCQGPKNPKKFCSMIESYIIHTQTKIDLPSLHRVHTT